MPKKLTTEEFIVKAKRVYGDRYDYSKCVYRGTDVNISIVCPIHGIFQIRPHNFLKGHGCPVCSNRQRIDTEVFVKRAKEIHKNRYDYSKSICKDGNSLVTIICPIHGEFTQKAQNHLRGHGCPKCFGSPKNTTDEFVEKAKAIYGDKYDYSKIDYKGSKIKVRIICPIHGEWTVTPNNFLRGSECPKCFGTPKYTTEQFVAKAKEVHGTKYDYSKTVYDGGKKKISIICPIHGEFKQNPMMHLKGYGCPICSSRGSLSHALGEDADLAKEIFTKRSLETHTTKYDYSKVKLKDSNGKVCIICPTHGEFWQGAGYHMRGGDCPKCAGSFKLTYDEFVEKAKKVHGDKYDYSKVVYKNYSTKVCIICPEHGEFWQTPNSHLFGAGCPACPQSNMEGEVRLFLLNHGIEFEQEKTFEWLKYKKKMFLDFYLAKYRLAIECQGGQHFHPVEMFGGNEFFEETVSRDRIKRDLCEAHGIDVLYFTNSDGGSDEDMIRTFGDLLVAIRRHE